MGLLKIQEPKIVSLGQGVAAAEIAHRLEVSRASVHRVIEDARAKTEGKTETKVKGRSASGHRVLEAA